MKTVARKNVKAGDIVLRDGLESPVVTEVDVSADGRYATIIFEGGRGLSGRADDQMSVK